MLSVAATHQIERRERHTLGLCVCVWGGEVKYKWNRSQGPPPSMLNPPSLEELLFGNKVGNEAQIGNGF